MTAPRTVKTLPRPAPAPVPAPGEGWDYPDAYDVCPIDSMLQYIPQSYMQWALTNWYDGDPMTLIASGMFIYYNTDDGPARVGPDVYVIPGVSSSPLRRSYFMWAEERTPVFALEVVSVSNYRRDTGFKRELYQDWGVQEYWLYDPNSDRARPLLTPPLQGFALAGGRYEAIAVEYDADSGMYRGSSSVLGLELRGNREWFRFVNPATGEALPDPRESELGRRAEREGRLAEREGRLAEREGRRAAEARARQLEDEVRRLRGGPGKP